MKKDLIFKGTATALITPFKNGEIDYSSLSHIIDIQLESKTDALVIAGTTGECSTLSDSERYKLYKFASERVRGKVPLIFGTGTNDTRRTIEYSRQAKEMGANALLLVTPYYNKGTDEGLIKHYLSVAESADLPIILYNVPSRTSVNLSTDSVNKLADHEKIVAIKEASDSLDRLVSLSMLSDKITLYSGNDSQIYATLALGGMGIISVASNIIPARIKNITDSYFEGNSKVSLSEQKALLPFINTLFLETNPSPIKYAMSKIGICGEEVRLPLTPPRQSTKSKIEAELSKIL